MKFNFIKIQDAEPGKSNIFTDADNKILMKKYHQNDEGVRGELYMINSGLEHKNLMGIIGYDDNKIDNYIEMYYVLYNKNDWIDLIDIFDINSTNQPLIKELFDNMKEISLQIIDVVKYLHNNDIVHRDIKPDNILYKSDERRIILCDFEYCMPVIKDKLMRKMLVGTPQYFAPELNNNSIQYIDYKKLDIYNIGYILYVICFYEIPNIWKLEDTLNDKLIIKENPSLKNVFLYTLEKDPDKRKSLGNILELEYFR